MLTIKFGVDISQEHLDLAWALDDEKARTIGRFSNQVEQFEKAGEQLKQKAREHNSTEIEVIMEPTGGYEAPFAIWCYQQGWKVCLPNPQHARHWSKGKGQRAKTDKVDSKMLARYGWGKKLPAWRPLPEKWAELDELVKMKNDHSKYLRQLKNRLHALEIRGVTKGAAVASLKRSCRHCKAELEKLEKELNKRLVKDQETQESLRLLKTCPGIGEAVALPLLLFLVRWSILTEGKGKTKGVVAMAGLDPQPHSSGKTVYRSSSISKQGDKELRTLLFSGARGGVRAKDGPLVQFYRRLRGKGHVHKSAVTACARKTLCWAWAVFRDRKDFDIQLAASRQNSN